MANLLTSDSKSSCSRGKAVPSVLHPLLLSHRNKFPPLPPSSALTSFFLTSPGAFLNPPQHTIYQIYFPTEKDACSFFISVFWKEEGSSCYICPTHVQKSHRKKNGFNLYESFSFDSHSVKRYKKEMRPKWNALIPEVKFAKTINLKITVENIKMPNTDKNLRCSKKDRAFYMQNT